LTTHGFAANVAPVNGKLGWESAVWRSAYGIGFLALSLGAQACTPDARPLPEVPAAPGGNGSAPGGVQPTAEKTWSYRGETGPDKWASLGTEFSSCSGPDQSPISLPLEGIGKNAADPALAVTLSVPNSPLQAESDGRLVTLHGTAALTLFVAGQPSSIDKVELHVPAEHQLGGARLDAELVLHAKGPDGRLTLLSLLYRTGAESAAWAPLLAQLPKTGVYRAHPLGPQATLGALVPESAEVLAYDGSLSTPPCSPAARFVVAQVGEMSSDQLARLRQSVPESARPTAALGQRSVTLRTLSKTSQSTKATDKQTP
jgi:carbonic anhydrase